MLEVIIDYGSALVTYGNEIESKGVQFPGRDEPDKINTWLCSTGTPTGLEVNFRVHL